MTVDRWNRLSDWHNAWLAADAAERERLRSQLAASDPALLTEADALAAASADLRGFLETPAFVLAAPELAKDEPLLEANTMVGPYRIVALLARGGMGDVYHATDVRLRRDVALKLLSRGQTGDTRPVERFVQEARLTASLDHPNIVRLYDIGLVEGRPYFVGELLAGETLRACSQIDLRFRASALESRPARTRPTAGAGCSADRPQPVQHERNMGGRHDEAIRECADVLADWSRRTRPDSCCER